MKLQITTDCCETARQLIANGLDPAELLEFYRGDILSLRGTARAFAGRMVKDNNSGTPVHVPYLASRYKGRARRTPGPPVRQNHRPLVG
jgi:hypothetical protein